MKTINNIFQLFKIISESHYQINGFVYGDINEVESYDKLKYPLLIASPILSVVSENVINHTYRISISDLVRKDEENQIEIWSDTQQILNDLIKVFRYDSVEFELIGEPILTPFKEKWGDDVSGWQADLEIQFDFDASECGVPIDAFLVPGPTEQGYFPSCIDVSSLCDVELTTPSNGQVLVYQDGIWVNQNQSGGGGGGAVDSVNGLTGVVVLTTANISDSLNRRYITDALLAILNNTSGVNTGDQDLSAYALLSALSAYLPLAGGTMNTGAIVSFTDSIDLQGGNVTDYSKAWIWSDVAEMQMGFGSDSIIRAGQYLVLLQAQNSFIQIAESPIDKYIRLRTTFGADYTELKLNASLASEYISTTNNPLNYAGDYSANFTDNSLITKKFVQDNYALISQLPISNNGYRKYGTAIFERWYAGNGNCSVFTTQTIGRNNIQYMPLIVGKTCTLASIGVDITTGGTAGSLMTISLYNSVNSIPINRVVDCGTLLVDAISVVKITGLSTVLTPGLYWWAINHNSTTAVGLRAISLAGCEPILGFGSGLGSTPGTFYVNTTSTYATSLPSTAVTPIAIGIVAPPAVYFYLSA